MRPYPTLVLSLLMASVYCQEDKEYITKLNKDTTFLNVLRLDKKMALVFCEEGMKKVKYEAKALLAVKIDTVVYESGWVRLKPLKRKRFLFLKKIVQGDLSLYEINVKRTKFLLKSFVDDFIHLRWVYRAHDWLKPISSPVYFYKKENETRVSFSRHWKEKTRDCTLLLNKFNSKIDRHPDPLELVRFYNSHCK